MAKKEDNLEKLCGVPTSSAVFAETHWYNLAVKVRKDCSKSVIAVGYGFSTLEGPEIAVLLDDAVKNGDEITLTGEYLSSGKFDIKTLEIGKFRYKPKW